MPTDLEPLFYGGHHGSLLASKTPLVNKQLVDYTDKFLVSRAALYAEVQGAQVACTHLSARLAIPYDGAHGSSEGQQRYEIQTVLDFMAAQADGRPQLMLGDWNCGPDGGPNSEARAEFPENYALVRADGWGDQNVDTGAPFATWSPANTLYIADATPPAALDHIFVKGAGVRDTRRILDQPVNVSPVGEPPFISNLSDHYGMRATVFFDP